MEQYSIYNNNYYYHNNIIPKEGICLESLNRLLLTLPIPYNKRIKIINYYTDIICNFACTVHVHVHVEYRHIHHFVDSWSQKTIINIIYYTCTCVSNDIISN